METLLLHVGHGKTGSSFLQSVLALSNSHLYDSNIFYPSNPAFSKAEEGKITSGNASVFLESLKKITKGELHEGKETTDKILFSSEVLFHWLVGDKSDELVDLIDSACFEKVKVLLYIRDPIDHAASSYQQSIKRGGSIRSIEDFFLSYKQPKLVTDFVEKVRGIKNCDIKIINYSNVGDELVSSMVKWLGVDPSGIKYPPLKKVNRSLTRSELFFQRELNRSLGKSGGLLADPLCEFLPEVVPEKLLPSKEVQEAMYERLEPYMLQVNELADSEDNKYRFKTEEGMSGFGDEFVFSSDQLTLMAKNLGEAISYEAESIPKLINSNKNLHREVASRFSMDPAVVFRDLAISYEAAGNKGMALYLMSEARKARPNGPFINKKISEYKNEK